MGWKRESLDGMRRPGARNRVESRAMYFSRVQYSIIQYNIVLLFVECCCGWADAAGTSSGIGCSVFDGRREGGKQMRRGLFVLLGVKRAARLGWYLLLNGNIIEYHVLSLTAPT